nr:hypothetical protein [uncultured Celeribacter sp.]
MTAQKLSPQDQTQRRRVILMDDVTRTSVNGVEAHPTNLDRLAAFLRPLQKGPFARADFECLTARSSENGDLLLDTARVMKAFGLGTGPDQWALLHQAEVTDDIVAYLSSVLGPADLILGMELPTPLFLALKKAGYRVMDFGISPIRFTPELTFEIRSTDADLYRHIGDYALPDATILRAVTSLSGLARRDAQNGPRIAELGRVGVIFGQTALDTSLIQGEGMFDMRMAEDQIRSWAAPLDTVLYKTHPFHEDLQTPQFLQDVCGKVQVTTFPTYQLLSYDNVTDALAISSGTLIEATYFGVRPQALMTPPRWKAREFHHLAVTSDLLSPASIMRLLGAGEDEICPDKGPDLRLSFGGWGDQEKVIVFQCRSVASLARSRRARRIRAFVKKYLAGAIVSLIAAYFLLGRV